MKIGQYLTKLMRTKQKVLVFWTTLYFKSALSSSKADKFNIWCKNCRVWKLL